MPPTTADLELNIAPLGHGLGLTLRLLEPDIRHGPFPVVLDQDVLRAKSGDIEAYGAALRDMLFAEPQAREGFIACRAAGLGAGKQLRVRLLLPPNLHHLRWEALLDPHSGRGLARDGDLLHSRYLSGDDYTPLLLRPKGALRALVSVAAPADAQDYGLAPINSVAEATRINTALGELHSTVIIATWAQLSDALREGYDILYLVAHGMLKGDQPWLYLVDEQGNADLRRGGALSDLLRSLRERRPRLVVLASCESAGDGYADALAALGPQLARAGVPAVLAMQGKLSITTNECFAPVLFRELARDGLIDQVVNRARLAVEDRPDWWMPVLYTRLRDGLIWWKHEQPTSSFTLRSVTAQPEEIAEAQTRLAELPTDIIPEPQDTLPPGSWVGQFRRNRQFVGREDDLKALAELLKGGQAVAVSQAQSAVASGMGGIGKTQLAVEFAYRYGRFFPGVFWLSFAQADTIPTEIARLGGAGQLQLFTEAAELKLDEQVNLVRARLACGLPYLLILDNCEEPDLVRTYHPGGAARVLITSRNPDWPGDLGVQHHALETLRRAESIQLLRTQRPDLSDADLDALATELGDLPLALHLAGRFLAGIGKSLSITRYLEELRSPRIFERLPLREQDGKLPTGHSRDVARTFALSYERLDPQYAEDAVALKLLARVAHLMPGEIVPIALLRAALEADADDLDAQLAAEAGLERLINLGLLERKGDDGLQMHRLVGAYMRQVSRDGDAQGAVERAVLVEARRLKDEPTLALLAAFQPLLRGVTDLALLRKDVNAATLCNLIGRHLDRLGAYAIGQPYLEQSLALYERVLGPEHPETIISMNNLAGLYRAQGNIAAAYPLYERALEIRERVLGTEHPDTAASLNNLALLYHQQADYTTARSLYERALAIRERTLGSEHSATATSLSNLARLHHSQADYAAARPLYERALAIRERTLGPEHHYTAAILNSLAGLYRAQGNYEAARPLLERALAICERTLGPEHPQTADSLNDLAKLYRVQGDYEVAQPLLERALVINQQVLGPEHYQTADSLNNLAEFYQEQRDYDTARTFFEKALAVREQVFGPEHPATASILHNLAFNAYYQGNFPAAVQMMARALQIREAKLGLDHPKTCSSRHILEIIQSKLADKSHS